MNEDLIEINKLTDQFFSAFDNTLRAPNLDSLKSIFIKEGIIISNNSDVPLIYNLDSFIEPRIRMLSDGTLTHFREGEVSHETSIFRNIAQRFSVYEKSGKLNGEDFKTEGKKSIQFIKVEGQWKISSVAWSDKE
ncbi:hypothetical protein [Roseivirga sp. E12]|uniref:hypothetical protein n=1 Tax=Roseivirga sp. E12 TaxID=2819237 RepID=UPI001ABC4515|nr:hypothetical protein [Roseivirga sp. E12]MBO3697667.1 hypothetical protein [Roseivirga sp. E12]